MSDETLTWTVEELYTLYHQDLVRFFADHLTDRDAAWDLCHVVFVRLLITLATGTQLRQPQHWLMRIAKNLVIDTYRRRQTEDRGGNASSFLYPGDGPVRQRFCHPQDAA